MAPHLVRLYESQELCKFVKDDSPEVRTELLDSVTELLDIELSDLEKELLSDVLITLMKQAETDLRLAIAEKLAQYEDAPLRLILYLVNDELSIATPVLKESQALTDMDLMYIINAKNSGHWQAIADRNNLSGDIVNALADTKDVDTAVVLAKNTRTELTEYALTTFTEMAEKSEKLAGPLIQRPGISEDIVSKLYDFVGAELKQFIHTNYGGLKKNVSDAIDDTIKDHAQPELGSHLPSDDTIMIAQKAADEGRLHFSTVMDSLQKGHMKLFVAQFSAYTGLSVEQIYDFIAQAHPKRLAVVCRAHGILKNDFSRIFLLTHRIRAKGRRVKQNEVAEILEYFDSIRPEAAQSILRTVLKSQNNS